MISRRDFSAGSMASALLTASTRTLFADQTSDTVIRILAPKGSEANIAPARSSFETLSGCKTEIVVVDVDEINAVLSLEKILGEYDIDVALPATFGIPDLAEAGAILALDTLAREHGSKSLNDQLMYKTGDRFDEKLWGYQTDGDVFLMFYNKRLPNDSERQDAYAQTNGYALQTPTTWHELDRQMAFFHRPDAGTYGGCLFRTPTFVVWEWWARLHAKGTWPLSPTMEPQIAGPDGVGALEDMIATSSYLEGQDLTLFGNWARVEQGDIYANIGWGGTQKSLRSSAAMRDNIVNAPLPDGFREGQNVPMSYYNWGWSYVVARNSKNPELAYQFCANAVSQDVSADAIAQVDGFFDPFRSDQYANPSIVEAYGSEFLEIHQDAMAHPIPDLYLARRSEYFDTLSYWIMAALSGEYPAKTALQNVAQSWRLTTERAGMNEQVRRWLALRNAYPPHLRAFLQDE